MLLVGYFIGGSRYGDSFTQADPRICVVSPGETVIFKDQSRGDSSLTISGSSFQIPDNNAGVKVSTVIGLNLTT